MLKNKQRDCFDLSSQQSLQNLDNSRNDNCIKADISGNVVFKGILFCSFVSVFAYSFTLLIFPLEKMDLLQLLITSTWGQTSTSVSNS